MSRIYFEAPHRQAQVYGSERGWLGFLAERIALGTMQHYVGESFGTDLLEHVEGFELSDHDKFPGDPFKQRLVLKDRFETWARVGSYFHNKPHGFKVGGKVVPAFDFLLNTGMVLGDDVVKLAAKIHGTCEDFAWVAAEDCRWFSDLIRKAREDNLFRDNAGWEDVLRLAYEVTESGNGPIVMHYSVSESFPSAYAAERVWSPPVCRACTGSGEVQGDTCEDCYGDPYNYDAWYDLSDEEQWELSVRSIQQREYNRQISPATLPIRFLGGEHLFDIIGQAVHEIPPMG